jgi:glycosyltransferase involved in cell wall biosynthesis
VRIAFITPTYGARGGGAGRLIQQLARHIERGGDSIEVVLHTMPETAFADEARRDGIVVQPFRPRINGVDYALSAELRAFLRRAAASFDLIHVHGYRSLPALPALRGSRRPLVFSPHYHGVPVTRLRRVARQPYRQLARRAVAVANMAVCISHAEASALETSVPQLKHRIRVVPAGADASAIHAAEPYQVSRTTIVSVGPIERGKRLDRVISTLPDLGPEYELVIIGEGPERRPLAMHAHELGVAPQVRFAGALDDGELFRWLRSAHVVVSMADEAMSGATLLEAACAGVPVIASDIPAHLEAAARLPDGAVRLVSSQASPLVVADEIKAAVERGPGGLRPSVMSWDEVAAQTTALYRELVAGDAQPPQVLTPNEVGPLA